MYKLKKINRKIKAGMVKFIKNEDPGALKSVVKLSKERDVYLQSLSIHEKDETV